MSIVKVGWSGGKDSTCSVLLHLEKGDFVKACCYIPMFTKDIPLISKSHYDFILNTANTFRQMGAEVYIVSGLTYFDYVTKITTCGPNEGRIMGFPCIQTGKCGFKRDSKVKAIRKLDVGYYDYEDIGIAIDEPKRHNQLTNIKRSILVEMNYTEQMAKEKCISYNLLSPHYQKATRDGCALCYNARARERINWFIDFPEAIPLVIYLQDIVKKECPERAPLRNYRYFIDTEQITLFGDYFIN